MNKKIIAVLPSSSNSHTNASIFFGHSLGELKQQSWDWLFDLFASELNRCLPADDPLISTMQGMDLAFYSAHGQPICDCVHAIIQGEPGRIHDLIYDPQHRTTREQKRLRQISAISFLELLFICDRSDILGLLINNLPDLFNTFHPELSRFMLSDDGLTKLQQSRHITFSFSPLMLVFYYASESCFELLWNLSEESRAQVFLNTLKYEEDYKNRTRDANDVQNQMTNEKSFYRMVFSVSYFIFYDGIKDIALKRELLSNIRVMTARKNGLQGSTPPTGINRNLYFQGLLCNSSITYRDGSIGYRFRFPNLYYLSHSPHVDVSALKVALARANKSLKDWACKSHRAFPEGTATLSKSVMAILIELGSRDKLKIMKDPLYFDAAEMKSGCGVYEYKEGDITCTLKLSHVGMASFLEKYHTASWIVSHVTTNIEDNFLGTIAIEQGGDTTPHIITKRDLVASDISFFRNQWKAPLSEASSNTTLFQKFLDSEKSSDHPGKRKLALPPSSKDTRPKTTDAQCATNPGAVSSSSSHSHGPGHSTPIMHGGSSSQAASSRHQASAPATLAIPTQTDAPSVGVATPVTSATLSDAVGTGIQTDAPSVGVATPVTSTTPSVAVAIRIQTDAPSVGVATPVTSSAVSVAVDTPSQAVATGLPTTQTINS